MTKKVWCQAVELTGRHIVPNFAVQQDLTTKKEFYICAKCSAKVVMTDVAEKLFTDGINDASHNSVL